MKKLLIGLVATTLIGSFPLGICNAQTYSIGDSSFKEDYSFTNRKKPLIIQGLQLREDAKYIIHRTVLVLEAAKNLAQYGRNNFGLGQAFSHQREATNLYRFGKYREAIYHSLRARNLGMQVIERNIGRSNRNFSREDKENRYMDSIPKDNELDRNIRQKMLNDDEIFRQNFNLDVND